MKAADISSPKGCFYHRGRVYRSSDYFVEPDYIWSKDKKLIGFGISSLDIRHDAQPPELWFRPAVNARNAVMGRAAQRPGPGHLR
ncbi:MAG: hypothetical protein M2R45_04713 [Verrucomicrobia subdivision 3 bacterium]|nr:hypothetical protein [Limisphaerales bacterium]MCS1416264.1 hypothetical protein [Limisphaerales bacterium]